MSETKHTMVQCAVVEHPTHVYVTVPHPERPELRVVAAELNGPREVARANAHFITKACNSHSELLAVCEAVIEARARARGLLDENCTCNAEDVADYWDLVQEKLEAVIATVRGETA